MNIFAALTDDALRLANARHFMAQARWEAEHNNRAGLHRATAAAISNAQGLTIEADVRAEASELLAHF